MPKKPLDRKLPKKTKSQEDFEKHMVAYFDEKLLNVVYQVRAVCLALKLSPEKFWEAFVDDKAQDDFYVKLHVAQDNHNIAQQKIIDEEKGKQLPAPSVETVETLKDLLT